MRQIMVTGGSGFIGSNFIRYILNKYPNYGVVNYDKLTYAGNPDNLKDLEGSPNYDFVHADIDDIDKAVYVMRGCDAVINFAAESHVDRSIKSAREFMTTNVVGTQTLLEAARAVVPSRFIHVSTDEVYGSRNKGSFTEKDCLLPSSPYSASKASSDLVCLSYMTTYGMPVIITRSSNNFGPYQYPEKLIPLLITNAMAGNPLPIYGDGKNVRDWIFVEDNCAGIDAVLHRGDVGKIYNIGGGMEVENIAIALKILKIMGKPESLITYVPDRLGHDRRYSIDSSRTAKLGWAPAKGFDEALLTTVDWYKANESWWRRLKQEGVS
ncbi:MAG: dTDP-glucose 4,6-dehydratase [Actinomycetota bacterium]|nr:dTDP-glucose 4,6-dehydratase [Actinomycetota bacterium]